MGIEELFVQELPFQTIAAVTTSQFRSRFEETYRQDLPWGNFVEQCHRDFADSMRRAIGYGIYDEAQQHLIPFPRMMLIEHEYVFDPFEEKMAREVCIEAPVPVQDPGRSGWGNLLYVSGNFGEYTFVVENGLRYYH